MNINYSNELIDKIKQTKKVGIYKKEIHFNYNNINDILNLLKINVLNTYIELDSLKSKDKEKILSIFLEYSSINDYKNYFDLIFPLGDNKFDTIFDVVNDYEPENMYIYDSIDYNLYLSNINKISNVNNFINLDICNYIVCFMFDENLLKVIYNKDNFDIESFKKNIKNIRK